jgi:hypothetical protein
MKFSDITKQYKLFGARVKVKNPGYSLLIDTTVTAKSKEMARRLLKAQYGKDSLINSIKEIE